MANYEGVRVFDAAGSINFFASIKRPSIRLLAVGSLGSLGSNVCTHAMICGAWREIFMPVAVDSVRVLLFEDDCLCEADIPKGPQPTGDVGFGARCLETTLQARSIAREAELYVGCDDKRGGIGRKLLVVGFGHLVVFDQSEQLFFAGGETEAKGGWLERLACCMVFSSRLTLCQRQGHYRRTALREAKVARC